MNIPPYPKEWTEITCAEEETILPLPHHLSISGESALKRHTRPLDFLTSDLTFPFLLKYTELAEPRELKEQKLNLKEN